MTTIKSRELASTQETKIFLLDTFALFFATKDSEGTSEFPALSSPQAQSPASCFADKTSWRMRLQLHRKQYVVQTTQNTEKMLAELCDKLIKFAEQIYFPWPNLGESFQGKQSSCLDHHQCSKDKEPGVFQRLDLI